MNTTKLRAVAPEPELDELAVALAECEEKRRVRDSLQAEALAADAKREEIDAAIATAPASELPAYIHERTVARESAEILRGRVQVAQADLSTASERHGAIQVRRRREMLEALEAEGIAKARANTDVVFRRIADLEEALAARLPLLNALASIRQQLLGDIEARHGQADVGELLNVASSRAGAPQSPGTAMLRLRFVR